MCYGWKTSYSNTNVSVLKIYLSVTNKAKIIVEVSFPRKTVKDCEPMLQGCLHVSAFSWPCVSKLSK